MTKATEIIKITNNTIEKEKKIKISERYYEKRIIRAAKKGNTATLIKRKAFGYYRFDPTNFCDLSFLTNNGYNVDYSKELDGLLVWWDKE